MDACGYDCPSVSSVNYHYLTNASSERDGVRVEGERERAPTCKCVCMAIPKTRNMAARVFLTLLLLLHWLFDVPFSPWVSPSFSPLYIKLAFFFRLLREAKRQANFPSFSLYRSVYLNNPLSSVWVIGYISISCRPVSERGLATTPVHSFSNCRSWQKSKKKDKWNRFRAMIDGEKIGLLHLNGLQLSDYRISCRSTELPLTYLPCHLLSLSLSHLLAFHKRTFCLYYYANLQNV